MSTKKSQIRKISWDNQPSTTYSINIQDYLNIIEKYGKEKSRTVRSSRKFLREIGMIDLKGNLVRKKQ